MKKRYLVAIMIAGILIGMSAYHYLTRLGPGDTAPGFTLKDISGKNHTLEDYRGEVVLLHFWATWCRTCLTEIPALEHIQRMYKKRGLKIVSILVDEKLPQESLQAVKLKTKISFEVLFDSNGSVAESYDSFAVPETFFIDREGKVLKRISGGVDWNGMPYLSYIEDILKR